MADTPFNGSTINSVDNLGLGGMTRDVVILVNRIVAQLSTMIPGLLLGAPVAKTGTTDAKAWRTEAFTFMFRGLKVSAVAQEKALTATTHDVAASKEAWYYLSVQTNGTTFTVTKAADQTIGTKLLPTLPDNEVHVSTLQIISGASGFTAATHNLSANTTNILSLAFYDAPYLYQIGSSGTGAVVTA